MTYVRFIHFKSILFILTTFLKCSIWTVSLDLQSNIDQYLVIIVSVYYVSIIIVWLNHNSLLKTIKVRHHVCVLRNPSICFSNFTMKTADIDSFVMNSRKWCLNTSFPVWTKMSTRSRSAKIRHIYRLYTRRIRWFKSNNGMDMH